MRMTTALIAAALALFGLAHAADREGFTTGPVIEKFGPVADIEGATPVPADAVFRISFDVTQQGDDGAVNRSLESAARFINMHARAGVAPENVHLALVFHGKAIFDLVKSASPENRALIEALQANDVRLIVCAQSAAAYKVRAEDFAPGVELALSAMTAHARLQQAGYTLNPF